MRFDVPLRGVEVGEGPFRLHELKVHQPTGGVVDEDQEGAARCPGRLELLTKVPASKGMRV